jgi:hypothetical protein
MSKRVPVMLLIVLFGVLPALADQSARGRLARHAQVGRAAHPARHEAGGRSG